MFAVIDIPIFLAGLYVGIRYKDNLVSAWQHLVAWIRGAESYAAALEAKAKSLTAKAEAVKDAATKEAKS